MKRLSNLALLCTLACSPALAAISVTAYPEAAALGTSVSMTATGVTAGDYLVIMSNNGGTIAGALTSMTGADNQDHTGGFGAPTQTVDWPYGSTYARANVWVIKAGNTANYLITISTAVTERTYLWVFLVTGASGVNTSGTASSYPAHPSVTLTTTVANCAIFGLWTGQNPSSPYYDSGFTGMGDCWDICSLSEYKTGASSGSNAVTFSQNAGSIIAIALQPPTSGKRRIIVTQ